MDSRKQNISRWCALGFAAALLSLSVVLTAGVAFARYWAETKKTVSFSADVPASIYLGTYTVSDTGGADVLDPASPGLWEQVGAVSQLPFWVANGPDSKHFESREQSFQVRLIVQQDTVESLTVKLLDPRVHDITRPGDESQGYIATGTPIAENSPMYQMYGGGWVYDFQDADGITRTWNLKGGEFSCLGLVAVVIPDGQTQVDANCVQLQVIGQVTQ